MDWEDVTGFQSVPPVPAGTVKPKTDIDALVQTVRAQVHADIQERCGKMRVLDMEQPIGLGDIYTSVNILEKLSGRRRLGLDELLQDCDLENFDRFLLGQVRHERVPGLEAVERHNQLMILGKPGAGKTTFMKRLAILCNQGEFQPQRVPVFVTLKDYAEAEGKPNLQTYIQHQWKACGVESADTLSTVLGNGKALVLLDGLDEVYETDHDRVLQDIKTFAHQFRNCQCVITCRIAAREYIFERFTEVEVADFDLEQIAEFSTKWFAAKNDSKKAKTFIQRLKDNKPIQELATNPLLLTLLCLVFGEAADFPANRAELYREGLDVLLKKWDGKRNIERDQVYKKLSLKRKEDLLSQLAFTTFERGDYFVKQATVEQHIIQYIRNLTGSSDDEEVLQMDGEAVLKSIEAQHGLLVERARGIYSFSHLTFQEYFTAHYIISPTPTLNQALQNLATHINEKRYREIFFLTAGMLAEADILLFLIKRQIDLLMTNVSMEKCKLQEALTRIQETVSTVDATYKPASIRAFYFALAFDCGFDLDYSLNLARELDYSLAQGLDYSLSPNRNTKLRYGFAHDFNREGLSRDLDQALHFILHYNHRAPAFDLDINDDRNLEIACDLVFQFGCAISEQMASTTSPALRAKLRALKNNLPNIPNIYDQNDSVQKAFKRWWIANGDTWPNRLQAVMNQHYNIGRDWRFHSTEKEKLRQYYNANKLLVECLNSDCYVTKATRQYIEDTLLLPLSEIEKYPVPDAIANL
ncbi:NACHT domain-containing protein [Nodosilinea nodulosa]|uniref:NACHT domain-containing protein n=1 Tax=Nodosilinea nodulosa TaxID=416001 RepID=UPI001CED96C7|nr:NACHT domain-containing NTPase [Nodosilinea nodulosa]